MSAHASLSASGSAKWLACAAALATEEAVGKPDTGSTYASEGTAAHQVGYMALSQNKEAADFLGQMIKVNVGEPDEDVFEVTQEMVNALDVYTQYIRDLNGINLFNEVEVDYSHVAPEGWGTADAVVEQPKKLYVGDLKYGIGIKVEAFENSQGMLYAVGVLNSIEYLLTTEIEEVVIVIIQPRIDSILEYSISVTDLKKWAEETVKPKAAKAAKLLQVVKHLKQDPNVTPTELLGHLSPEDYNPTEKGCQWCRAKHTCKARANQGYAAAVKGFSDLNETEQADIANIDVSNDTLRDTSILSNEDLVAVYNAMKMFSTWAKDLQAELIARLESGQELPGYKLVATVGNRAWQHDEAETIKALRTAGMTKEDYYSHSLISPTQAEKVLKELKPGDHKKRYKKLEKAAIHKPPGADTIAPEKDKRPAIVKSEVTEDMDFLN